MPRLGRPLRALLGAAVAAGLVGPAPADAAPPAAPASLSLDELYAPPSGEILGPAGSIVWWRDIAAGDPAGLAAAARSTRVIYRSTAVTGDPAVMSATVFTPRGDAPATGRKTVVWNHVTTGGADHCAPSRAAFTLPGTNRRNPEFERLTRAGNVISRLLGRGYVVVRPDYEGIGTPGPHPYLIGRSLARSTVDAVRATRELVPGTTNAYAVAGHSEGGMAALWTSHFTRAYAPELALRATLAATPPIDNAGMVFDLGVLTGLPQISSLAALMVNGARVADPALAKLWVTGRVLNRLGRSRFAHLESRCLAELSRGDSLALPFGAFLGPAASAAKPLLHAELDRNDAFAVELGPEPVRFVAGTLDPIAWWSMIRQTAARHRRAGADVTFKTYPLGTHANITDERVGGRDIADWIASQLG